MRPSRRPIADRAVTSDALSLPDLAQRLQDACLSAGLTVVTAESCTGGLIAHAITSNPGSSRYFLGGVVSYSDAVKQGSLGVPAALLQRYGAVSAQVAMAMAVGVRERLAADLGVGVTGVAGPDGGSDEKPVGLVYIGVSDPMGTDVRRFHWTFDRVGNIDASAAAALRWLTERVHEQTGAAASATPV
jgi:PncC family amidohydrolase